MLAAMLDGRREFLEELLPLLLVRLPDLGQSWLRLSFSHRLGLTVRLASHRREPGDGDNRA